MRHSALKDEHKNLAKKFTSENVISEISQNPKKSKLAHCGTQEH